MPFRGGRNMHDIRYRMPHNRLTLHCVTHTLLECAALTSDCGMTYTQPTGEPQLSCKTYQYRQRPI